MFEDSSERRTSDSIKLFQATINSSAFFNIPVYLLLNKVDELPIKLKNNNSEFLNSYPEFKGDINNIDSVIDHIKSVYLSQINEERSENAQISTYITCAVDSTKLSNVFEELAEKLLKLN